MPRKIKAIPKPPLVIAYSRFSTAGQADGISEERQGELAAAYCAKHGLTLDNTLTDRGLSGFHGAHLSEKAALGAFLKGVETGAIPPGSMMILESLDRLSRLPPVEAIHLLTGILLADITVVTTMNERKYTADSSVELFEVLGLQSANHGTSAEKGRRMVISHAARRGTHSAIMPSWIKKHREILSTEIAGRPDAKRTRAVITGIEIDHEKAAPVIRMMDDVQHMGVNQCAKNLNRDGLKRPTGKAWTASAIRQLVRSRTVLGEQAICRWDGKNQIETGEFVKDAYPAIVTHGTWFRANAAIDQRQRGVVRSRHSSSGFPNLFGKIARCAKCGGSMTIRDKARADKSHFKYLGCSLAVSGQCDERHYHRLDLAEANFLRFFDEAIIGEIPEKDDPIIPVIANIDNLTAEIAVAEKKFDALFEEHGTAPADTPERKALSRMRDTLTGKQAEKKKQESILAGLKSTKPVHEQLDLLRRLMAGLGSADEAEFTAIRSELANTLPSVVKAVRFGFDYEDAKATVGHRRVRVRKTPVPMIPVSRFSVEIVDDLPITLPNSRAGKFVRYLQEDADRFKFQSGDVVDTKPGLFKWRTGSFRTA
jgi:hypothetical protein